MSCNYPRIVFQDINTHTGELVSTYSGKLYYDLDPEEAARHYAVLPAPCGHCAGCANDKARVWADRMVLELDHHHGKAIFVTCTYDDDHLPLVSAPDGAVYPTVSKRDAQLWLKSLRKKVRKELNPDLRLRYYLALEYGKAGWRPHLHAIIFGLSLSDFQDLDQLSVNEFGQPLYDSPWLSETWERGNISVAPVTYSTMSYCAHYTTKKMVRDSSSVPPFIDFVDPERALMSRRPGLGGYYLDDHPDLPLTGLISYSDGFLSDGKTISLPRYVLDKYRYDRSDEYDAARASRLEAAHGTASVELAATDQMPSDYYRSKDYALRQKLKLLHRD